MRFTEPVAARARTAELTLDQDERFVQFPALPQHTGAPAFDPGDVSRFVELPGDRCRSTPQHVCSLGVAANEERDEAGSFERLELNRRGQTWKRPLRIFEPRSCVRGARALDPEPDARAAEPNCELRL